MERTNNIDSFPSIANSNEKLRIQHYFDKQGVIDSCPKFIHNNNVQTENHKYSSSLILAAPSNHRSTLTLEKAIEHELNHGCKLDPNMDKKKLRRTISNRLSAQRSRMKKYQYIDNMEKRANDLQELISFLTPQVESYKEKQKLLMLENNALQKLVEIRSNESKLHELELENKKNELYKLKEVEKIVNKDDHGSSSRAHEIHDSSFTKFMIQPYQNLGFYQLGLQYLQNQPGSHQFSKRQLPSSLFVQSELRTAENFVFEQCSEDQASDFKSDQPVELGTSEENQEEANIDQYLNFEALNAQPPSG